MVGLGCQIGPFGHGYGSGFPFRILSYKGKSPAEIRKALEARQIAGLRFQEVGPTPQNPRIPKGVLVYLENWDQFQPTELNWHLMQLTLEWEKENPWRKANANNRDLFNKHTGSSELWDALTQQGKPFPLRELQQKWQQEALQYQQASSKYWLYPP